MLPLLTRPRPRQCWWWDVDLIMIFNFRDSKTPPAPGRVSWPPAWPGAWLLLVTLDEGWHHGSGFQRGDGVAAGAGMGSTPSQIFAPHTQHTTWSTTHIQHHTQHTTWSIHTTPHTTLNMQLTCNSTDLLTNKMSMNHTNRRPTFNIQDIIQRIHQSEYHTHHKHKHWHWVGAKCCNVD